MPKSRSQVDDYRKAGVYSRKAQLQSSSWSAAVKVVTAMDFNRSEN